MEDQGPVVLTSSSGCSVVQNGHSYLSTKLETKPMRYDPATIIPRLPSNKYSPYMNARGVPLQTSKTSRLARQYLIAPVDDRPGPSIQSVPKTFDSLYHRKILQGLRVPRGYTVDNASGIVAMPSGQRIVIPRRAQDDQDMFANSSRKTNSNSGIMSIRDNNNGARFANEMEKQINTCNTSVDGGVPMRRTLLVSRASREIVRELHIPTVPASMSMGAEYEEEEEEVVEDEETYSTTDCMPYISRESTPSQQQSNFICTGMNCMWRGNSQSAFRRHLMEAHPESTTHVAPNVKQPKPSNFKPKGVRCSECEAIAYSRPLLLKHMTNIHGIEAPLVRRTFNNREDLTIWLEELRTSHAVEFVVSSGSKKWGFGLQVHYLICSRSGEQKERPNKKGVRPPRPSIKCGKNCMAYLKIKQNPVTSTLQIEGCLFHSGHTIDPALMRLTDTELEKLRLLVGYVDSGRIRWAKDDMVLVRDFLGNTGRFRLVSDLDLYEKLGSWLVEARSTMDCVPRHVDVDNISDAHHLHDDIHASHLLEDDPYSLMNTSRNMFKEEPLDDEMVLHDEMLDDVEDPFRGVDISVDGF